MNIIRFTPVLAVFVFLLGCASGATKENMNYQGDQKVYDERLKNNIEVAAVSGGESTNPLWTSEISSEEFSSAVKQSLSEQGLLSENGKYQLQVKMIEVDQPSFGFDMTVTTHVQYVLTDTTNHSVILDEVIVAPYTATTGDAFAGYKRLQLANEGSGKKNIEGLLEKLSELKINRKDISIDQ
jgi:hypothetical protein